MELCFHRLLAQADIIELLYEIYFLFRFQLELQSELAANETLVSAALCLTRMHPSCFQMVLLLEDCIDNGKITLSAELEQEASIVNTVTNALPTKDCFPGH